jgi:predicted dinucleotide-utilizing enzyme
MERLGIGIIGCGNISEAYLKAASYFPILDIKGVADIRSEAAETRASQFGLRAMSVDAMLADPSIEIIVNLTVPAAHVAVGMSVLAAGKHSYSESRSAYLPPKRGLSCNWPKRKACASDVLRTHSWADRIKPAASSSMRA